MSKAYREFHFAKARAAIAPLGGAFPDWLKAAEDEEHPADHVAIMAECALRTIAIEFASANEDRIESLEEAVVALRECCAAMEALEGA